MMNISGRQYGRRRHGRSVAAAALAIFCVFGPLRAGAACVGDCDDSGSVTVDELVVMVDIALGTLDIESCAGGGANADGQVTVDEIVTGVNALLDGCPGEGSPTPTATAGLTAMPTASPTPTTSAVLAPTPTSTEEPTGTATATPTVTATPTENGVLSVAEAVARDADGVALHLGQTVTTEGVVTVAAGILANNKLKIFIQDGDAGIMVYHQSSAAVDAFQPGQRLRATGVIIQQDPTSDANPATGTVAVDITEGSWSVLSDGNPLPDDQLLTLATLNASGTAYTGSLVRVVNVQKVSGSWPAAGSKSTQVDISDDGGTTTAILRFQRNTITTELAQKLDAIGTGSFTLIGIVVQDDATDDGKLLSGFEIWVRGAQDVVDM
jgi:hypothetical protein